MRFSDTPTLRNWLTLLMAFIVALGLWYTVSVRDRIEAQFTFRLEFKGQPQNLIITSGLVHSMTLRARGPEALMRSINTQNLVWPVDLSKIQRGSNIIPLLPQNRSPSFRAFEIIDMTPPRLVVEAEPALERSLPLAVTLQTDFAKGVIEVRGIRTIPEMVLVRGPESTMAALKNIPVPLRVGATSRQGAHSAQVPLSPPLLVTTTPPTVTVQYEVASSRRTVVLERPIAVSYKGGGELELEPDSFVLEAEIPANLADNISYLRKLQLHVNAPPLEPGASATVPLEVTLPPGMQLKTALPGDIAVTRKKK